MERGTDTQNEGWEHQGYGNTFHDAESRFADGGNKNVVGLGVNSQIPFPCTFNRDLSVPSIVEACRTYPARPSSDMKSRGPKPSSSRCGSRGW
jgi:hypothetical protein